MELWKKKHPRRLQKGVPLKILEKKPPRRLQKWPVKILEKKTSTLTRKRVPSGGLEKKERPRKLQKGVPVELWKEEAPT